MSTSSFEADWRQRNGSAIIDLSGEINRSSEDALNSAYSDAIQGGATSILLNFVQVDYINSTGIAVIVGLLARARADARTVMAYGLSDHYRGIFEITRLSDFMPIFDAEEDAVSEAPAKI
ncbi:MAG: STAS domain-containing protein [Actinomycetota bacterium]|nr:STAS domain-containing protein [Actinomycetota bacterium]